MSRVLGEAIALVVHFEDIHVVHRVVEERTGEALGAEGHPERRRQ